MNHQWNEIFSGNFEKRNKRCWEWTGPKDKEGYGKLPGGKPAHRVSYQLSKGAIPKG